jgi:anhydro-N-acetylmuramic acid kinase
MEKNKYSIIGLMSGSSLDGLDIALCEFEYIDKGQIDWKIITAKTYEYSPKWQLRLEKLPEQSALIYAKTHSYFGHYMGELVNQFIEETGADPDCIASHGHTIFHYPNQMMTAQIGDGAALATKTGFPVISDFRTHDIALKGEGTPLAPTVDRYLFSEYEFLLNLGGIANVTQQTTEKRIAFDITPCNQILNALAHLLGQEYDDDGKTAASGDMIPALEKLLNTFPFYKNPYPKSLDNQFIINKFLPKVLKFEGSIADKLHTCCKVFGQQIAISMNQLKKDKQESKLLVTGGGAYNSFLIQCIQEQLNKSINLILPDSIIIEYKEALLMALLGLLRIKNQTNCFSEITGAMQDSIGGAIYQGIKKRI